MAPHIRALIAASAYAFVTGDKVAGIYDHAAGRHLRIAAECRGSSLQGYDGDRAARFGGTLPEIFDTATQTFVSMMIEGARVQGYDRASSTFYTAEVTASLVQLYDHGTSLWSAFAVQIAADSAIP
ncbi:hypothetical protein [Sphingomonas crocodyli]|uniref:Uncharacterized protein n=1 Tax=Sphingomonas crocodyli TaxID=1979270 RepID=A0A437M632_9SPHN|nr:hypothetical protein [Sphingomonas crocodyli]RVT93168.1 hypothetical protein EOD43_04565 [Sphingomonas crocodyli]